MLACYFDNTFSGLLTALFDAFQSKRFPDLLLPEGGIAPLTVTAFCRAETDQAKAGRVWDGLKKKLSQQGLDDLTCVWLSEQEGAALLLFRYLRKVFSSSRLIETDYTDQDVLAVAGLARKVYGENHSLLGFTRFQKTVQNVYFASIAPRYNVLPLMSEHFADRFADQPWIIFDVRRHYGVYCENRQFNQVSLEPGKLEGGKLRQELLDDREQLFQELWKGYLKSVTIQDRVNPKLQANLMPRRFWPLMTEFWPERTPAEQDKDAPQRTVLAQGLGPQG